MISDLADIMSMAKHAKDLLTGLKGKGGSDVEATLRSVMATQDTILDIIKNQAESTNKNILSLLDMIATISKKPGGAINAEGAEKLLALLESMSSRIVALEQANAQRQADGLTQPRPVEAVPPQA
jgi:hypothetical protein